MIKIQVSFFSWFIHKMLSLRCVEHKKLVNQGKKRERGRPKKAWKEAIENEIKYLNLNENMCFNRTQWRALIHIANPT